MGGKRKRKEKGKRKRYWICHGTGGEVLKIFSHRQHAHSCVIQHWHGTRDERQVTRAKSTEPRGEQDRFTKSPSQGPGRTGLGRWRTGHSSTAQQTKHVLPFSLFSLLLDVSLLLFILLLFLSICQFASLPASILPDLLVCGVAQ